MGGVICLDSESEGRSVFRKRTPWLQINQVKINGIIFYFIEIKGGDSIANHYYTKITS
jgi:hypothetical protein